MEDIITASREVKKMLLEKKYDEKHLEKKNSFIYYYSRSEGLTDNLS